ncbi:FtsW/RodA/SpoVE family cell cycle protein [Candidatus Roizmanbacteria bacterium]|nr:FtsW/RodA/SpoVE family cell cycle protein [Candidatus Roizmanbacteria bacterium]
MAFLIPTFLLVFFSLFNLLGINQHYFISQLINFGVGLVLFFVVRKIGTQFFRQNSGLFYWLFLGILIITFIIGIEAKGSRRWIDLFFFNFQASEFFKIFFLIFIVFHIVQLIEEL